MNNSLLFAVLAYEILVIVGLGFWVQRAKNHRGRDEFALAHRSLPMPVVAVTLALTVLGTAHILGVFEMAWILGAAAIWFSIAHVILLVVVCLGTGLWVRRIGVTTVPQLLQLTYGIETRLMVSCVMAGVLFGILTVEAQGMHPVRGARGHEGNRHREPRQCRRDVHRPDPRHCFHCHEIARRRLFECAAFLSGRGPNTYALNLWECQHHADLCTRHYCRRGV